MVLPILKYGAAELKKPSTPVDFFNAELERIVIKQAMNQGYEVVESALGRTVEPADERCSRGSSPASRAGRPSPRSST